MPKIQTIICSALILLGVADLLTTVVGVTSKGAIEVNPMFATLTQTNISAFIGLKLLAVLFTSFLFIGAAKIAKTLSGNIIGKYFVPLASMTSCFIMTTLVANNLLIILNFP